MKDFKETKSFENILAETGYKVVMFYADWCGPCNMLKPIVAEVSKELTNVNFHKINIDEFRPVAVENGVRSVPTLVIFKDRDEIGRYPKPGERENLMGKENLLNWLNRHFN